MLYFILVLVSWHPIVQSQANISPTARRARSFAVLCWNPPCARGLTFQVQRRLSGDRSRHAGLLSVVSGGRRQRDSSAFRRRRPISTIGCLVHHWRNSKMALCRLPEFFGMLRRHLPIPRIHLFALRVNRSEVLRCFRPRSFRLSQGSQRWMLRMCHLLPGVGSRRVARSRLEFDSHRQAVRSVAGRHGSGEHLDRFSHRLCIQRHPAMRQVPSSSRSQASFRSPHRADYVATSMCGRSYLCPGCVERNDMLRHR